MNSVSEFVVGSSYSNDQIRFSLRVGNLGGVRPSTDEKGSLRHIAIMTSTEKGRQGKTKNPYKDLIEGDILVYTASGRKGDQLLSGSNKRVTEQYAVPVPIFGFINKGQQVYEYLGLLELVRHYQEEQIDGQGSLRKVWIFEFRIHNDPSITPLENASAIMANLLAKSRIAISATGPEREVIIDPKQDRETTETQVLQLEEVRAELLNINPYRFEYLVKELIENCGFNKVQVTKSSGDGGIDLNAVVVDSNDFFSGTFVQFQVKMSCLS